MRRGKIRRRISNAPMLVLLLSLTRMHHQLSIRLETGIIPDRQVPELSCCRGRYQILTIYKLRKEPVASKTDGLRKCT
ncbi:hypothetical protein F5B18DRAFT_610476 [Nemania serpens]|nr:hypothetical protein F5B18DRAFT_610476 [Nemania serpens]